MSPLAPCSEPRDGSSLTQQSVRMNPSGTTIPSAGAWRDRIAFEIRDQSRTFLDVALAAAVRGDLAPFIERSARLYQGSVHARESGLDLDMASVETAIEEFRYARDLVTLEETERWLDDRGLNVDDLTGHFLRRFWFKAAGHPTTSDVSGRDGNEPPPWPADLILSGEFTRLARLLAGEEIAILDRPGPTGPESDALLEGFRKRMGLGDADCEEWLARHQMDRARLLTLLHGQAQHTADQLAVLTDPARVQMLGQMRSDLCRAELEVVEFDHPLAAQEAYLCATSDRLSMETVAMESGFSIRSQSGFLRDLPEPWRMAILSASPGRVLQPLAGPETISLVRLVRRIQPGLKDPVVRAEVDQALWQRHFGEAELREIRWRTGGNNPP